MHPIDLTFRAYDDALARRNPIDHACWASYPGHTRGAAGRGSEHDYGPAMRRKDLSCLFFDFEKDGFLYLAAGQYRFNRRFDMSTILTRLINAAAATSSRTEAWMRLAEDER
jgi:hypothetical protein